MQLISYLFFRFLVLVFYVMPFGMMYRFSNFIKWVLKDLVKYRVDVVKGQLATSFPEKSEQEINAIADEFYSNLADIFLEGIKGFSMTKEQLLQRWKLIGAEKVNLYKEQNKSVILNAGHYNNFEWGTLAIAYQLQHSSKGVYKALKNKYIEAYLSKNRSRTGLELLEMTNVGKKLIEYQHHNSAFIFGSDQSPSNISKAYWVNFLGQETAFIHGVDQFARSLDLPVFYLEILRVKRGFYEVIVSPLVLNPNEKQPGEITQIFAQRLEESIKKNPASWLWSHKRWKHKRQTH